jgi:hypothetical protein
MTTSQLEKQLIDQTKGLHRKTLEDIIDFIQFVRLKNERRSSNDLRSELSLLDSSQNKHLEEEIKDYKKLYPIEEVRE